MTLNGSIITTYFESVWEIISSPGVKYGANHWCEFAVLVLLFSKAKVSFKREHRSEQDRQEITRMNTGGVNTHWWWLCLSPPAWYCLVWGPGGLFSSLCAGTSVPNTSEDRAVIVGKNNVFPLRYNFSHLPFENTCTLVDNSVTL